MRQSSTARQRSSWLVPSSLATRFRTRRIYTQPRLPRTSSCSSPTPEVSPATGGHQPSYAPQRAGPRSASRPKSTCLVSSTSARHVSKARRPGGRIHARTSPTLSDPRGLEWTAPDTPRLPCHCRGGKLSSAVRCGTHRRNRACPPEHRAMMRPSGLEPPPGLPRTRPSTLRVYQFRHRRSEGEYSRGTYADRGACRRPQVALQCEHMFVAATIERGSS